MARRNRKNKAHRQRNISRKMDEFARRAAKKRAELNKEAQKRLESIENTGSENRARKDKLTEKRDLDIKYGQLTKKDEVKKTSTITGPRSPQIEQLLYR